MITSHAVVRVQHNFLLGIFDLCKHIGEKDYRTSVNIPLAAAEQRAADRNVGETFPHHGRKPTRLSQELLQVRWGPVVLLVVLLVK